jgi:hypothetical protein
LHRLVRQALVVTTSLCVTLLVLEGGYRLVLRAQGAAHSASARKSAYEGNLGWILRPHGQLALGTADLGEDAPDIGGTQNIGTVLSPYLGVDQSALLADYLPRAEYFAGPEAEQNFDVLVLGGSVAAILVQHASEALAAAFAADPRLAGREVRVHGQARPGFKAPQTSILCNLLFQLGWRPDLVVLLDGFNEVAMGNENRVMGGHPLYPSIVVWTHLAPETDLRKADIDQLVELRLAEQSSRRLLEATLRLGLYRSALASRLMDALLSRPAARHTRALQALEPSGDAEGLPLALRGPPPPADVEVGLAAILRIWVESSTSLAAACDARGIPFVHVLQPTLYDVGAKPITPNEARSGRISPAWKEGVIAGYPRLREQGQELRRRGVQFFDGSRLFESWTGDLYYDCCHLTPPGSETLARFIAERARELTGLVRDDR